MPSIDQKMKEAHLWLALWEDDEVWNEPDLDDLPAYWDNVELDP